MRLPLLKVGDCRELIRELPDASVHCVVTSPPYWGMRDYHLGDNGIGNEPSIEAHIAGIVALFEEVRRVLRDDGTLWLNYGDRYNSGLTRTTFGDLGAEDRGYEKHGRKQPQLKMHAKNLCGLPWRIAFALQSVGWILRSDIIWSKPNPMPDSVRDRPTCSHEYVFLFSKGQWKTRVVKFADLDGERVHFSLNLGATAPHVGASKVCVHLASAILDCAQREHGVSLFPLDPQVREQRSAGSGGLFVCDSPVMHRAAVASARFLMADASTKEFVRELDRLGITLADAENLLIGGGTPVPMPPGVSADGEGSITVHDAGKICQFNFSHKTITTKKLVECRYFYDQDAVREAAIYEGRVVKATGSCAKNAQGENSATAAGSTKHDTVVNGRNKRTVWTIPTQPTPEAHFATFPEKLVEPCILAGTSERGCCVKCGAPMVREVERTFAGEYNKAASDDQRQRYVTRTTNGFRPSCDCGAEQRPCVVLDPFFGSGTVGRVADRLGRHWIGFEMNPDYAEIARKRTAQPSLFAKPMDVAQPKPTK